MAGEIYKLSKLHPEETFMPNGVGMKITMIAFYTYLNVKMENSKELGIKPEYGFYYPSSIPVNKEEQ